MLSGRSVDLPMGIGFTPTYGRHRFRVSPGDRMLLFTDGVLETTSPTTRRLTRTGSRLCSTGKPAAARTLHAFFWRPSTGLLEDTIVYELPLGLVGRLLVQLQRKLRRLFAYGHAVTRRPSSDRLRPPLRRPQPEGHDIRATRSMAPS